MVNEDAVGILYSFEEQSVVFSTLDQTEKLYANFGDMTNAGFVRVSVAETDNIVRLISIADGSLTDVFIDPYMISDCGQYFYERPVNENTVRKYDFHGNMQWEISADTHDIVQRLGAPRSNYLGVIIGEREGQFWYQEGSGVVKAINSITGELELSFGSEESDLTPGKKQREGEQLFGTFSYKFSENKDRVFGMGGQLYTEIDLRAKNPRRKVYNCQDSLSEHGMRFGVYGPSHPVIDNKLIICDYRNGMLGALDLASKKVTWSLNMFPNRGSDFTMPQIHEFVSHEDLLYVMTRKGPEDRGTLLTFQRCS